MRHFVKGAPPAEFEAWKAMANDEWQPTYGNLQNPQKRSLHKALLDEQGQVCCYCGRSISLGDSHIEHFRPQEQREDLDLVFENLFASCIRETEPGTPLTCGHAKGQEFDETRHISPLDPECERRFTYSLAGAILPLDDGASYMLQLLSLDHAFLGNRRLEVLKRVFDDAFIASATAAELRLLAQAYRASDETGRRESFGHVVARYAEQLQRGAA